MTAGPLFSSLTRDFRLPLSRKSEPGEAHWHHPHACRYLVIGCSLRVPCCYLMHLMVFAIFSAAGNIIAAVDLRSFLESRTDRDWLRRSENIYCQRLVRYKKFRIILPMRWRGVTAMSPGRPLTCFSGLYSLGPSFLQRPSGMHSYPYSGPG